MNTLNDLKAGWLKNIKGMEGEGMYIILFNSMVEDLRNSAGEWVKFLDKESENVLLDREDIYKWVKRS